MVGTTLNLMIVDIMVILIIVYAEYYNQVKVFTKELNLYFGIELLFEAVVQ